MCWLVYFFIFCRWFWWFFRCAEVGGWGFIFLFRWDIYGFCRSEFFVVGLSFMCFLFCFVIFFIGIYLGVYLLNFLLVFSLEIIFGAVWFVVRSGSNIIFGDVVWIVFGRWELIGRCFFLGEVRGEVGGYFGSS